MERIGEGLVLALLGYLTAMNPHAATGAAFGCTFFLASPAASYGWQRVRLAVFSWGVGYAAGIFFFGDGPPYSSKAMLVAAIVSALAAVAFLAFYHVIDRGGPLPAWLDSILDRLPFTKRKGPN